MEGRDDASMLDNEADTDSDDDAAPCQVPEGLCVAVDSPKELTLTEQKQNPKTDELVGKKIMYAVSVKSSWTGITYLFYSFPVENNYSSNIKDRLLTFPQTPTFVLLRFCLPLLPSVTPRSPCHGLQRLPSLVFQSGCVLRTRPDRYGICVRFRVAGRPDILALSWDGFPHYYSYRKTWKA